MYFLMTGLCCIGDFCKFSVVSVCRCQCCCSLCCMSVCSFLAVYLMSTKQFGCIKCLFVIVHADCLACVQTGLFIRVTHFSLQRSCFFRLVKRYSAISLVVKYNIIFYWPFSAVDPLSSSLWLVHPAITNFLELL